MISKNDNVKNSKQSGIVAIESCFALFGARQYGCCAILTSPKKGETAVYGYNPALFWVLSVSCWFLAELIFTSFKKNCTNKQIKLKSTAAPSNNFFKILAGIIDDYPCGNVCLCRIILNACYKNKNNNYTVIYMIQKNRYKYEESTGCQ